jgi:hypothetical protein
MSALSAVWLSNETPGVIESLAPSTGVQSGAGARTFCSARGPDRVDPRTDSHGAWIEWLDQRYRYRLVYAVVRGLDVVGLIKLDGESPQGRMR